MLQISYVWDLVQKLRSGSSLTLFEYPLIALKVLSCECSTQLLTVHSEKVRPFIVAVLVMMEAEQSIKGCTVLGQNAANQYTRL